MHKIRIKDNIHANARNAVPICRELLRNSEISYRSHWHRSLSSDRHHLLFYIICEKWPEYLVSRNEYIFFGIFHHVSQCITSNAHKVSMQILKLLIFYSFIPLMILSSLLSDVFLVSLSFFLSFSLDQFSCSMCLTFCSHIFYGHSVLIPHQSSFRFSVCMDRKCKNTVSVLFDVIVEYSEYNGFS